MKTLLSVALVLTVLGAEVRGDYIVTDLGGGIAYGINASGQVVGQNAAGQAFLYSNGTSTDLGTLGGPSSVAYDINNSGQVVGVAGTAAFQPGSSLPVTHAFLYSQGMMTDLTPSAVTAGAKRINTAGQVVGWSSAYGTTNTGLALGPVQPFLYSNGSTNNVGSFAPGSVTYALGINDSGQVVGYTYQPGITGEQPFIVSGGTTQILGVSGDFEMINAGGQAVGGHYFSDTAWQAQLYSNGTRTDLGTLGGSNSWAYGINDGGQIVGDADTAIGAQHAFLYENGSMIDLNSLISPNSSWSLETAYAINDSGQIVGVGVNGNGQSDAFLLSPAVATPEPGSLTLLCTGLLSISGYLRFRGRRRASSR